ncbi:hypothetical protein OBBRIDRAFT_738242 [Obba rivulosa]|uniref:Uncharacterized protein n=1 Tax=Obba rivulosa TaxID=1052685 RepID=A0A8E2AQ54_9APHY|nr:hypothetical protein OBBRIDRAFT_738242 [Obba rivulosa]
MWIVKPEYIDQTREQPVLQIIHLDSVVRAAHLMPVFMQDPVPLEVEPHNSLYAYASFYINKYINHHAFETIF